MFEVVAQNFLTESSDIQNLEPMFIRQPVHYSFKAGVLNIKNPTYRKETSFLIKTGILPFFRGFLTIIIIKTEKKWGLFIFFKISK